MVPRRVIVLGHPNSRRTAGLLACVGLLALCALASIAIGSRATSLGDVLAAFSAFDGSDEHVIVRELRVPRMELGLLVGAALGAAGALMQGVTRNPVAEPGLPDRRPRGGRCARAAVRHRVPGDRLAHGAVRRRRRGADVV